MLKFNVTVPGKVILHGEHSVVFGHPGIAGVIGLKINLNYQENSSDSISFDLEVFSQTIYFKISTINELFKSVVDQCKNSDIKQFPEAINHEEYLKIVKDFVIRTKDQTIENTNSEIYERTMSAILYLLTGIMRSLGYNELKRGFSIQLKSEFSIGGGLGSSASFAVGFASAFLTMAMNPVEPTKEQISKWAYISEKIMHGTPSGLDNTICTYGNVVKFYRNEINRNETLIISKPINLLLINSGVQRSTAKLAKSVGTLRQQYPKLIEQIMTAMGVLVEDAWTILKDETTDEFQTYESLKTLIKVNNNLLRSIGASHPALEQIFKICDTHGFASKLTGAGGGGFATVLLPPDYKTVLEFKQLCKELSEGGFEYKDTTIGGAGVTIDKLNSLQSH